MKKTIFLMLALALLASGCAVPKIGANQQKNLTIDEAKTKVTEFINKNLVQPGSEVSIKEVTEDQGMYKVVVNTSNGQEVNSYLTKDGKMFFPQVMNIEEVEKTQAASGNEEEKTVTATEIPKQDKAKAELFVMSFCPYGVQAEDALAPVVDLLGDKADIQVRFIASIEGKDLSAIKSLHGVTEGMEDVHQLCVAKEYDQKTLWKYIAEINKNCYPTYREGDEVYTACWKAAAKTAGVDTKKIDSCVKSDGVDLIEAEELSADGYGVSGSPTLIINGVKFNGGRTPEAYKQAICNGFNEQPAECSKTLNSTAAAASGGCE